MINKERQPSDSEKENILEKLFGKEPVSGYEFRYVSFKICHSAIVFQWSCTGIGFGEHALIFDSEKGFDIDTECMGTEFSHALYDEACRLIDAGQKAKKWKKISTIERKWQEFRYLVLKKPKYPECMGYKEIESQDGNEEFIKNVILAFRSYGKDECCD